MIISVPSHPAVPMRPVLRYPEIGGLSGIGSRNFSREVLNVISEVILVNSGGKIFQSLAAFIVKLSSYKVNILPRSFGSGLTFALFDEYLAKVWLNTFISSFFM